MGTGRPSLKTPERIQTVLEAIRHGNKKGEAAKIAGVGYTTLRDWMASDDDLSAQVEQAASSVGDKAWRTMVRLLDSPDDNVAHRTAAWILDRKNLAGPDEDAMRAELIERVQMARDIWAEMADSVPGAPEEPAA